MDKPINEVIQLIDSFADKDDQKIVMNHFMTEAANKLNSGVSVCYSKINLLCDIQILKNKYEYIDEEKIRKITNATLELKLLEIRALILDLVNSDYSEDLENIYKQEEWIDNVISNIEQTFNLQSIEILDTKDLIFRLFAKYNDLFLKECLKIFVSKNNKFGSKGNQLMLNLKYYEKFVRKYIDFNSDEYFSKFIENFKDGKVNEKTWL
ncbi:hypothetical protein TCON_0697 [Astathelohania contejeani]|uniref:Uncharacterized protein n=1 Tax=Astathelohania contejeani TaxID=164912 RepID=A0ABQ7I118_9MICR|nr:hypothetical protein TCON_0697 [Thelohania contejeani]